MLWAGALRLSRCEPEIMDNTLGIPVLGQLEQPTIGGQPGLPSETLVSTESKTPKVMSSGPKARWETPDLHRYFLGRWSHLSVVKSCEDSALQASVVWDPDEAYVFSPPGWLRATEEGEAHWGMWMDRAFPYAKGLTTHPCLPPRRALSAEDRASAAESQNAKGGV